LRTPSRPSGLATRRVPRAARWSRPGDQPLWTPATARPLRPLRLAGWCGHASVGVYVSRRGRRLNRSFARIRRGGVPAANPLDSSANAAGRPANRPQVGRAFQWPGRTRLLTPSVRHLTPIRRAKARHGQSLWRSSERQSRLVKHPGRPPRYALHTRASQVWRGVSARDYPADSVADLASITFDGTVGSSLTRCTAA
jgi:hypothetical protein